MNNIFLVSLTMSILILLTIFHRYFKEDQYENKLYYFIWLFIALRLIFFMDISLENKYVLEESLIEDKIFIREESVGQVDNGASSEGLARENNKFSFNIFYIWLLGLILFLSFNLILYLSFRLSLEKSLGQVDDETLSAFKLMKEKLGIRKNLSIGKTSLVASPMIVGILRPRLVLPVNINRENLDYILCHELVHVKRRDLSYKFLIFIAKAIHWFNPLVHKMSNLASQDLEISCDNKVVELLGDESKIPYTYALLNHVNRGQKDLILTSNYGGGKEVMKKRIDRIFNKKKLKSGKGLIGLSLVFILSLSLLVACEEKGSKEILGSESKDLYELKTDYIGDNSKLISIVDSLEVSKKFKRDKIEIQSREKPYGLTIVFKETIENDMLDDYNKDFIRAFALVSNMDYIKLIDREGQEFTITREDLDKNILKNLNTNSRELGESQENFNKIQNLDLTKASKSDFDDSLACESSGENDLEYWVAEVYYGDADGKIRENSLDGFTALAVEIIDVFEEDTTVEVYSYVRKDRIALKEDGEVKNLEGFIMPNLLVFEKMDEHKYSLKEKIEADDGALHIPSLVEMTKKHPEVKDKLLNFNNDSLDKKMKDKIGRILEANNIKDYNLTNY